MAARAINRICGAQSGEKRGWRHHHPRHFQPGFLRCTQQDHRENAPPLSSQFRLQSHQRFLARTGRKHARLQSPRFWRRRFRPARTVAKHGHVRFGISARAAHRARRARRSRSDDHHLRGAHRACGRIPGRPRMGRRASAAQHRPRHRPGGQQRFAWREPPGTASILPWESRTVSREHSEAAFSPRRTSRIACAGTALFRSQPVLRDVSGLRTRWLRP